MSIMFPVSLSIVTYNIWLTERWNVRAPALRKFLEIFDPDVLCLQELQAQSRAFIDETLPGHRRVEDPLKGWTTEGNIYWRDSLFEKIEHGAEEVGLQNVDRRLFWARLRVRARAREILVATAHLTSQKNAHEQATGASPRVNETRAIISALQRLNRPGEPGFFMGDLNDAVHPPRLLHEAGYVNCFSALGIQNPPTLHCYPTASIQPGERMVNHGIDWLVANSHARAVAASVPHFYFQDAAPSDHWPVHAVYEIAADRR
jgi:endonuclease/exonuclease/phosphatase family metal-dependent hydrolase